MREVAPTWLTPIEDGDSHGDCFEWDQHAGPCATVAVPAAVGVVSDRDPTALPPLNRAVDPDALAVVLDAADVVVGFQYADHRVHVNSSGRIRVDAA